MTDEIDDIFEENWFKRHPVGAILIIPLGLILLGILWAVINNLIGYEDNSITGYAIKDGSQDNKEKSSVDEERIYQIGEEINIGDVTYKVTDVFTMPLLGNEYLYEEAKGIYVLTSISVKNNGKRELFISSNNYEIVDSQGRTYEADISGAVYAETMGFEGFTADTLGAGLETSGDIVFDVPEDNTGLILELKAPGLFGDKVKVEIGDVSELQ